MKMLVTFILLGSAALAGHLATVGTQTTVAETIAAESPKTEAAAAPSASPKGLIVHEWGTFTSFSGSNGVPVNFLPNNSDLPGFVYHHAGDPFSKSDFLQRFGTVSMETPVIYFYADKEIQASIGVEFPKGWITEWYPHAATAPDGNPQNPKKRLSMDAGETIRWNIRLSPGEQVRLPREQGENPYYHARETDAVPLQTTFELPENQSSEPFRGGGVTQRETFLFYRGVGTFSPPVTVQAMGGGKVRVANAAGGRATGMVLLVVRNGQISFKALDSLEAGTETVATLPETHNSSTELGSVIEKGLIAAGLYEREAQAMVKTWDHAWFREEGARILYVLPRTRTDDLLPLTVSPQPSEI
ncbi:MAG TPA: hypothetical protein VG097_01250, partial [Gemmata sp.]|nr:hypothetical protein [Gemmata sp.]